MEQVKRVEIIVEGIVQGVGFRPFVFRLASACRLRGWVKNTPGGVVLQLEGTEDLVDHFLARLPAEAPPLAAIAAIRYHDVPLCDDTGFSIVASSGGEGDIRVPPDGDVCADCLRELFNPADRRFRYPFITCTNCGPRYTIITAIPYDRPATTMARFTMCPLCQAEYDDPGNRRFHAQPNGCSVCGPRLHLTDNGGSTVAGDPVREAVSLLRQGWILAVKGVGGYHLAVAGENEPAVARLRRLKQRDEKPFALMAPDTDAVSSFALVDPLEARVLRSVERPIVLVAKRPGNMLAPSVAPRNGYFGVMLPATPLHHLLLRDFSSPLVMTSGNLSDEPIAYGDDEACRRLSGVADYFLTHDREIRTRCDDSVMRVFQGEPLFLRRSRGFVPRAIRLPAVQRRVLAVGAELKAVFCLTRGDQAFLSQHIGDLKNPGTLDSLAESARHLMRLLELQPEAVAHDLHPDYLSRGFAESFTPLPMVGVQHHHAHLAACMAEHGLQGEVIGVIFDGSGYGGDGTVWGGEFLVGGYHSVRRGGHLATVRLPGGDAAVREPWRMALAHLHDRYGDDVFHLPLPCWDGVDEGDRQLLLAMIRRGINSPLTSSCGRLFDAVAAVLGVRSRVSYEGQAAMELEALAEGGARGGTYPHALSLHGEAVVLELGEMFPPLLADLAEARPLPLLARRCHDTVAAGAAAVCRALRERGDGNRVVLSGGVFQNRLLTEELSRLLRTDGFQVFSHRLVPPNDGGLALGQAVIAGFH